MYADTELLSELDVSNIKAQRKGDIELRASPISRIGAFAAKDLEDGTALGYYSGEIIRSTNEANARQAEYTRAGIGQYMFDGGDGYTIDATWDGCPLYDASPYRTLVSQTNSTGNSSITRATQTVPPERTIGAYYLRPIARVGSRKAKNLR